MFPSFETLSFFWKTMKLEFILIGAHPIQFKFIQSMTFFALWDLLNRWWSLKWFLTLQNSKAIVLEELAKCTDLGLQTCTLWGFGSREITFSSSWWFSLFGLWYTFSVIGLLSIVTTISPNHFKMFIGSLSAQFFVLALAMWFQWQISGIGWPFLQCILVWYSHIFWSLKSQNFYI